MFSLRVLFGLYPRTSELEKSREALKKEFIDLKAFIQSNELAHFQELEKFVNSPEFEEKKRFYESLSFVNSEEQKNERLYLQQKKSIRIKAYYKTKASRILADYKTLEGSKELQDYLALETFIQSENFKKVKSYMLDKKRFEKTEDFKSYNEYKKQKADPSIQAYFKFIHSSLYKGFLQYDLTESFKNLQLLENQINSEEFKQFKTSQKKSEFKKTAEFIILQDYNKIIRSKEYKAFLKLKNSAGYSSYVKLHNSEDIKKFEDLGKYVSSEEFKNNKHKIESLRFNETPEYQDEIKYLKLKKSKKFRDFFAFMSSKVFAAFKEIDGSQEINSYEKLETYINSAEFKARKIYLLDKKKFEKSDEHKMQVEYFGLKKSAKIIWYYQVKDSNKFDVLKIWELSFEDDFQGKQLDRNKWSTSYFWGEAILNKSYSLADENQAYTENGNFTLDSSILKIELKKEKAKGIVWNPAMGFLPKDFEYTSGMISSGHSMRQLYGKFEAKLKYNNTPAFQAFWMVGEKMIPHIDISKFENGRIHLANFWPIMTNNGIPGKSISKFFGSKFTRDFFIYTLIWTKDKLEWRINDQIVKVQNEGIPQEPMYISFNLGLHEGAGKINDSAAMEIDWVKCFKPNS